MRRVVFHVAIACCTFAFSVLLSSIWNWGVGTDTPGPRLYVRDAVSVSTTDAVVSLEPGVWTAQPRLAAAEPELLDIYRGYAEAQTNHDIEFFKNVEAEDYVLFSDGKTMSRSETIEWLKNSPSFVFYTLDDVNIKIYGDAAVVTGRVTATYHNGAMNSWRWIDVCVKRDGRWQIQSTTQLD